MNSYDKTGSANHEPEGDRPKVTNSKISVPLIWPSCWKETLVQRHFVHCPCPARSSHKALREPQQQVYLTCKQGKGDFRTAVQISRFPSGPYRRQGRKAIAAPTMATPPTPTQTPMMMAWFDDCPPPDEGLGVALPKLRASTRGGGEVSTRGGRGVRVVGAG